MRRIMKRPEVSQATSMPASTIYWRVSRGEFPAPIKIGERSSGWDSEAVDAWIAAKIAAAGERGAT